MSEINVLIAGGTGLIGKRLIPFFDENQYNVRVLSRQKSDYSKGIFNWDPYKKIIDPKAMEGVHVIINLVGEGVADKKWTDKRKKELLDSRTIPADFLYQQALASNSLQQYISASGINCYGYENDEAVYQETDDYGKDTLSLIVKEWEKSADQFSDLCKVVKLRISLVLTADGGALPKIAQPIKYFVGAALGTGKQVMPWIHIDDLCSLFVFAVENNLSGTYNALANYTSNKDFTKQLAKALQKPLFLPNVPTFVMQLALGELSSVLLEGVKASNQKLLNQGFNFKYRDLNQAFSDIYCSKD